MRHKETLNQMEEAAPGTKHNFLFGYLDRAAELLKVADVADLTECVRCGMTTQAPEDPATEAVLDARGARDRPGALNGEIWGADPRGEM